MAGFPYWVVPVFSSLVWLSMLLAMILTWITDGKPRLETFDPQQTVPYISDIGHWRLKPLFIAMGTTSVVTFDIVFVAERWLRHLGKLTPNTSWPQKILSIISIIAAIVGAVGLILLTIFDNLRHPRVHDAMLAVFIVGYVVSAIAICAEYQRLGIKYREYRILRASFWIKLAFIIVEIGLAIAFGVTRKHAGNEINAAAIIEWVIATVYAFYIMSFALDFLPAGPSNKFSRDSHIMTEEEKAMQDSAVAPTGMSERYTGGDIPYSNGQSQRPPRSAGWS